MKRRSISLALAAIIIVSALLSGCTADTAYGVSRAESPHSVSVGNESGASAEYESSGEVSDESSNDASTESPKDESKPTVTETAKPLDPSSIPNFSGDPFFVVNDNVPSFNRQELTTESYEFYSELDGLGRCGVTIASVGRDIMPTEERGSIGAVKPTGWHTVKYDIVDGKYLYNRCHLIGYQLTGENANTKNLITGTRYLNIQGMLPFENMVADYVKETGNHVAYRVTPVFIGDNLLALGVQMEAYSVEDGGDGICFNVFCYNAQPGIKIDYSNGDSALSESETSRDEISETSKDESSQSGKDESSKPKKTRYVLNKSTKKFHYPSCSSVKQIAEKNYEERETTREELIAEGYDPCGRCKP